MSNQDDKKMSAGEIKKKLAAVLRKSLDDHKASVLSKKELTPREAGLKLTKALLGQISEYKEFLVQMGNLEKGELSKVTPPDVSEELVHKLKDQYGSDEEGKAKAYATAWKISKQKKGKKTEKAEVLPDVPNVRPESEMQAQGHFVKTSVFSILGAKKAPSPVLAPKAPPAVAPVAKTDTAEKEAHPEEALAVAGKGKGVVLPQDKMPKETPKDEGSGGKTASGKRMTKGESPIFKALSLSGKAPAAKMAFQHAKVAGSAADMKNAQMPARQQSVKMPTPKEHAERAASLAEFTPPGKFGKEEESVAEKGKLCKLCKKTHEGKCK